MEKNYSEMTPEQLRTSLEELTKKHTQLVDRVRRMRGYQREYFKFKAKVDLDTAKRLEREVDKLIDAEVKENESKQKNLFGQ